MTERAIERWIAQNADSLDGKTVAVSGATGGLGRALCRHLARLRADLWLLDRNQVKSAALEAELLSEFPDLKIRRTKLDLADFSSVRSAEKQLRQTPPDVMIFNAGIYSVPRYKTAEGFDNVFAVNFVAPYYLIRSLLQCFRKAHTRVVAVGSIAHAYSKTDPSDTDFSTRNRSSLVYGNSKRYLMFALWELFRKETGTSLSSVHPGITFTGITDHYPPLIFALIKYPMKVIFPSPRAASLSLLRGVFDSPPCNTWIGPRVFRVWGHPHREKLHTVSEEEQARIFERAEAIYDSLKM